MGSPTKKTEERRRIRKKSAGRKNKKRRAREGTPAFPIHPKAEQTKSQ